MKILYVLLMEIIIQKTNRKDKKLEAKIHGKTIAFGAKGMSDYTLHKDPERKQRYIDRHKKNENWETTGVETAGFYSRWILWNKPTITTSVQDLSSKFRNVNFRFRK